MTPDRFAKLGEAAYGPTWQAAIAREGDYNPRTVRRWVTGEWAIPDDLEGWLLERINKRAAYLLTLLKRA